MKEILRRKVRALVELMPWGTDIYQRWWVYPRSHNQVLGVYPDHASALAAAGGTELAAYDHHNAKKSMEKELKVIDSYFQESDYPALFWLSRILKQEPKVVELGGSVGYAFYGFRRMMAYPEELEWTVVELPAAVRLGRQIAASHGEHQLAFSESIDGSVGYGVFLTAGTLQYVPEHVCDIIGRMPEPPRHVIINRLPAYDGDEYWTVQNLGSNKVPYRIYSRPRLVEAFEKLGYRLRDSWQKPRTLLLPFAPERTVEVYHGFYFELPGSALTRIRENNFPFKDDVHAQQQA